jgi:hypothetical protein
VTATILVKVDALTIGVKRNFTRAAWRSAEIGQGADESVWGQAKGAGVLPFVCVDPHVNGETVYPYAKGDCEYGRSCCLRRGLQCCLHGADVIGPGIV